LVSPRAANPSYSHHAHADLSDSIELENMELHKI